MDKIQEKDIAAPFPTPDGKISILLFGETGSGKSSLANAILGSKIFEVCHETYSKTKLTFGMSANESSKNVFVIDTPGIPDTKSVENDKEHIVQMINYILKHNEVQALVIVLNYHQVKLTYSLRKMLNYFFTIFPKELFINQISVVFTNSYTKKGELTMKDKQLKNERIQQLFKEITGEEVFTKSFTTFFVDIDSEEGINEKSQLEINNLIYWASTLKLIDPVFMKTPVFISDSSEQNLQEKLGQNKQDILKSNTQMICHLNSSGLLNRINNLENDKMITPVGKAEEEKGGNKENRKKKEKKLKNLINAAREYEETKFGECKENLISWKAGVTEIGEFIECPKLAKDESEFQTEWNFGSQEKILEKVFPDKIIVGWKLESEHENDLGGKFVRLSQVCGTSSYKFKVSSFFARGCHWRLRVWVVPNELSYSDEDY